MGPSEDEETLAAPGALPPWVRRAMVAAHRRRERNDARLLLGAKHGRPDEAEAKRACRRRRNLADVATGGATILDDTGAELRGRDARLFAIACLANIG